MFYMCISLKSFVLTEMCHVMLAAGDLVLRRVRVPL